LPAAERNRARRRFRDSIRNGRMQDHKPLVEQPTALTAVPYYAWCNREKGSMTVWINEASR
jgi:DUF1680 family protein